LRATVEALKVVYLGGRLQWRVVAASQTNDLGQYRIYGLASASYYVLASKAVFSASRQAEAGFAESFYPATSSPAMATRLDLRPGAELHAIDLTLNTTRVEDVDVYLRIKDPVEQLDRGTVLLRPEAPGIVLPQSSVQVEGWKGHFVVHGVPVGNYVLSAQSSHSGIRYTGERGSRSIGRG